MKVKYSELLERLGKSNTHFMGGILNGYNLQNVDNFVGTPPLEILVDLSREEILSTLSQDQKLIADQYTPSNEEKKKINYKYVSTKNEYYHYYEAY